MFEIDGYKLLLLRDPRGTISDYNGQLRSSAATFWTSNRVSQVPLGFDPTTSDVEHGVFVASIQDDILS